MNELVHVDDWERWFDIEPEWDERWPNFPPEELRCRGTGQLLLVPASLDRVQAIRTGLGFSLPITSAGRAPEYNAIVSSTGRDGPHTTGHAVDIRIRGADALKLTYLAQQLGFTGIGVNQAWKTCS